MSTVTLPKKEYEMLKRKASLYEQVFRRISERTFGVERYSSKRIREFMAADRIPKDAAKRLKKVLNA